MALCSGCLLVSPKRDWSQRAPFQAPDPPVFLTGPARFLFTNQSGFQAHAKLEKAGAGNEPEQIEGQLRVRGSWLLFEPESRNPGSWRARMSKIVYLWDATLDCGYAVSLPLQGYTTLTSSVALASLQVNSSQPEGEAQSLPQGLCRRSELTFTPRQGFPLAFDVWRTADAQQPPVRVEARDSERPFLLELSDLHAEALAPVRINPVDGFTRYESVQAMLDEVLNRAMVYSGPGTGSMMGTPTGSFEPDTFPTDDHDGHRHRHRDDDRSAGRHGGSPDGSRQDGPHRR